MQNVFFSRILLFIFNNNLLKCLHVRFYPQSHYFFFIIFTFSVMFSVSRIDRSLTFLLSGYPPRYSFFFYYLFSFFLLQTPRNIHLISLHVLPFFIQLFFVSLFTVFSIFLSYLPNFCSKKKRENKKKTSKRKVFTLM